MSRGLGPLSRQGRGRAFSPTGHSWVIRADRDNSFSTILVDLRAANVFEIAEFSFQVVAVLEQSNNDSLTLLTGFFEGHPRLVSC